MTPKLEVVMMTKPYKWLFGIVIQLNLSMYSIVALNLIVLIKKTINSSKKKYKIYLKVTTLISQKLKFSGNLISSKEEFTNLLRSSEPNNNSMLSKNIILKVLMSLSLNSNKRWMNLKEKDTLFLNLKKLSSIKIMLSLM